MPSACTASSTSICQLFKVANINFRSSLVLYLLRVPRVGGGGCVVEEAAEDGGCGLERADDGEGGVGDGGGGDGVEEGGGGYADLGSGYVAVPFGCPEGWCCGDGWMDKDSIGGERGGRTQSYPTEHPHAVVPLEPVLERRCGGGR